METCSRNPKASNVVVSSSSAVIANSQSCQLDIHQYTDGTDHHQLVMGPYGTQVTAVMSMNQLEALHALLGAYLREHDAATRHVDPVSGCPLCPRPKLPEGEKWTIAWDHERPTDLKYPGWSILSDRSCVEYASGLTYDQAEMHLAALAEGEQIVQLAP